MVSNSLHIVAADGSGDVEALTETGRLQVPYAVTPDGTQLIISDRESDSFDIRTLSLTERSDPVPLIASEYGETGAALSPNGQLIAYVSDEAGPDQVFIRPMDNLRQKFQISADGGRHPVWSPSGDTLYYFRSSDSAIMMAKIDTERGFTATRPQPLFSAQFLDGEIADFDVSSDNQRLLILKKTISTGEASVPGLASLVVVDNWFARLREVAPIN